MACEYGWTVDEITDLSPQEINLLLQRMNERREAEAGKKGKRKNTLDMQDENNLPQLEMMFPGSVDFGDDG